MKKSFSSQNGEILVPIGQDVGLKTAIVGEPNEIGSTPRVIVSSNTVAAEPTLRLLQKRLRRERRST